MASLIVYWKQLRKIVNPLSLAERFLFRFTRILPLFLVLSFTYCAPQELYAQLNKPTAVSIPIKFKNLENDEIKEILNEMSD